MANRDNTSNGQAVPLSKGQLIRLRVEPGGLVPVDGPSDNRPAGEPGQTAILWTHPQRSGR